MLTAFSFAQLVTSVALSKLTKIEKDFQLKALFFSPLLKQNPDSAHHIRRPNHLETGRAVFVLRVVIY